MRNAKALEMLESGRIEELKAELRDEIYAEALKTKSGAKKRYSAMKKYFKYTDSVREALQKPCVVEFEGDNYTSFCNSYSLALTTEDCGEMAMFDTTSGTYPNVVRLINYNGTEEKIDFAKVIAEAKSRGYKLKKSELGFNYQYLMYYDGAYYKIGLIEATYGIIDDGGEATVYHVDGDFKSPLIIKNDIGVCLIMPMKYEEDYSKTIIEVKTQKTK